MLISTEILQEAKIKMDKLYPSIDLFELGSRILKRESLEALREDESDPLPEEEDWD